MKFTVIALVDLSENNFMVAGVVEGFVECVDNSEDFPDPGMQRVAYQVEADNADLAMRKAFDLFPEGEDGEDDEETCSECGDTLEDGGDGYDGLCADCADRAEVDEDEEDQP
jgi:hypothetical protein